MMTRTLILALSLTAAAPALAAEAETVQVRVADLDLSSEKGQQRLETRVKNAARDLCSTGAAGAAERAREAQCVADALAAAKPQADRAIARAESGTQLALLMVRTAR